MKKLGLMAAAALLAGGLFTYAASAGNEIDPPDCCKKACTTKVCDKTPGDSTCVIKGCNPGDCKTGK